MAIKPKNIKEVIAQVKLNMEKEGLKFSQPSLRNDLPTFPDFKTKEEEFMFQQFLQWYIDNEMTLDEIKESIQDAVKEEEYENANGIKKAVDYIESFK